QTPAGQNKTGPQRRAGWPSVALSLRLAVLPCYCGRLLFPGLGLNVAGGAEEIRTPDLRRAKAALSQLSYGPSRVPQYATACPLGQPAQRSESKWWAILDSNQRPQSYQDCVLTS